MSTTLVLIQGGHVGKRRGRKPGRRFSNIPCACGCGGNVLRWDRRFIPGHYTVGGIKRCKGTARGPCGYPLKTEADRLHGRCETCWDEANDRSKVNVG